jgi:hypothetical protein
MSLHSHSTQEQLQQGDRVRHWKRGIAVVNALSLDGQWANITFEDNGEINSVHIVHLRRLSS